MNAEIIGASRLATCLPSLSSLSLMISFSSLVRAHPIWLVVNHCVVSSGWEWRSVLISGMVYTTSPPHVLSPRPTYRGCAGDSSDSDVTSLVATPCFWAARGRLALGLGVVVVRLRTFLVVLAETRFGSVPVTHREHMARCSLFHSFFWNPSCSLRTLHFRHSLHHMTARTWYHHPSSSSSGVSPAKCISGMKKISASAAPVNATMSPISFKCISLSRLCLLASDCHPRMCARNSSDSPGVAAWPSAVARLRTPLTFSAKLSPNLRESVLFIGTQFSILYTFMYSCMLTLTVASLFIPFVCSLCA